MLPLWFQHKFHCRAAPRQADPSQELWIISGWLKVVHENELPNGFSNVNKLSHIVTIIYDFLRHEVNHILIDQQPESLKRNNVSTDILLAAAAVWFVAKTFKQTQHDRWSVRPSVRLEIHEEDPKFRWIVWIEKNVNNFQLIRCLNKFYREMCRL